MCTFLGQQFNFLNFVYCNLSKFRFSGRNFDSIYSQLIFEIYLEIWAFLYVFGCNVLIFAIEFVGKIEFWGAFVGI